MQATNGFSTKFKYSGIEVQSVFSEQWYEKGMYILYLRDETNSLILGQPLVALNEKRIDFSDKFNINGGDINHFQLLLFPQLTEVEIINGENPAAKYWYSQNIAIIGEYTKLEDSFKLIKQQLIEGKYGASFLETNELYLDKLEPNKMITTQYKIQLNYDFGIPLSLLDEIQALGGTITITSDKFQCIENWFNDSMPSINRINRPQEILDMYPTPPVYELPQEQSYTQQYDNNQYGYDQNQAYYDNQQYYDQGTYYEGQQGYDQGYYDNQEQYYEQQDVQSLEDVFAEPFDGSYEYQEQPVQEYTENSSEETIVETPVESSTEEPTIEASEVVSEQEVQE